MIGIGSTVGNYLVLRKLGSGAMGAVFLAEHPTIGKKVALKVIHSDLADNEEMLSRFFNEARAVTQIGHQNIVEVIDFGQTPDGDNFIVMELLEGRSLGDKLKETPIISVAEAMKIGVQIADGLEASHQRGIVHRDLKPDNVYLVTRLGIPEFVKILDFGLAKLTQGVGAMQHKTRAGSVLGTPHYMAPEQGEGKPDVDHRVDVYALGCILYQALCGRVPFPGDGFAEVLVKHLREPPVLPTKLNPEIPRGVEAIILHALAKKKEFRFQSMKEMGKALRDPAAYERELSGEVPLGMPTLVHEAPVMPKPVAPRVTGPVAKIEGAASTMLDHVPESVRVVTAKLERQAAHEAPVPVAKPSSGAPVVYAKTIQYIRPPEPATESPVMSTQTYMEAAGISRTPRRRRATRMMVVGAVVVALVGVAGVMGVMGRKDSAAGSAPLAAPAKSLVVVAAQPDTKRAPLTDGNPAHPASPIVTPIIAPPPPPNGPPLVAVTPPREKIIAHEPPPAAAQHVAGHRKSARPKSANKKRGSDDDASLLEPSF